MYRTWPAAQLKCLVMLTVAGALASAQDVPKPGAEHERLKEFVGTWDAVVKFGNEEAKGTADYKLECGGLWLVCEFTGDFGGVKFQGRGLDGYDVDKKKYVGIWVDSMTTSPMVSEGTYDAAAKKLTYHADGKGPDGKPAKIRSVTTLQDKDRHDFEMFITGADGKEQSLMSIQYTRRK